MLQLHRVLIAAAALSLPVAATFAGCGDRLESYPGVDLDVPNSRGVGFVAGGSGSGGGTTSSGPNLCQCAAGIESPNASQACNDCANTAVADTAQCKAENDACIASAACKSDTQCVMACNEDPTCIAACVNAPTVSQQYLDLLLCTCNHCYTSCTSPVSFPTCEYPTDAGADADAGDAAGE